jgi:hypothetical protein
MKLPELNLRTDATVQMVPQADLDGSEVAVVIIKQRFSIELGGGVRRAPGAKVLLADTPWVPDSPTSCIRYPSDLCIRKPSTDVIVTGDVVSQGRVPVTELDVMIRVGPIEKSLRVFGTRVWYRGGGGGLALSSPQPFSSIPLQWELAYGGTDNTDPRRAVVERRNPIGRGVAAAPATLVHQPGPQIEDPRNPIGSGRHPAPAGFGAIGPHFAPRLGYAGTMDDRWARERMPLRPLDFDERHNQAAPPDQITPRPLRGGERVQLLNLSERGVVQFELPRLAFGVVSTGELGEHEHPAVLDTVVLEPAASYFDLTYRTAISLALQTRRPRAIESVRVFEKRVL